MAKQSGKVPFNKKRVKYLSKQKHLTQSDIAKLIDRSIDTVKGIYREGQILPEQLKMIGRKLDASFDYLSGSLNLMATVGSDGKRYAEGYVIEEDRIDPEGYVIPHFGSQEVWEQIMYRNLLLIDPLAKAIENSDVLVTASGYINEHNNQPDFILEKLVQNAEWVKTAITYILVYSCGPKEGMEDYVLRRFKYFWDGSYELMKNKCLTGEINSKDYLPNEEI